MDFNPLDQPASREVGQVLLETLQFSDRDAVVAEIFECPHCEHEQLIVHDFDEVVCCLRCEERIVTRSPNFPLAGEPRAIDWEEAALELDPKTYTYIRDIAREFSSRRG